MKNYFVLKFLGKQRKFSFGLVLLFVVVFLCGYSNAQSVPFAPLPTWEVQNPVSTVFVTDSIPSTTGSLAAGNSTVPNEYLVDPAIDNLLMLMQSKSIYLYKTASHPSGIVGSDNILVIKGNFQWTSRNTTSTDRIKGLIWQILQHPDGFSGEIIICDNTQNYGINQEDNNSEDPEQSIVDVVNTFSSKGYPVSLRDWSNVYNVVVEEYSAGDYNEGFVYESDTKISYPKFTSPFGNHHISLRYGIWDSNSSSYNLDRLCLIDFPVLKAHSWSGATIAIKNWVGVLTTAYADERYGGSGPMHSNYIFGPYALVAKVMGVTFPKLTIVDADWTSAASNNNLNNIVHTKMLLGSTDPCAVSWYAAKYILTPIAVDPYNTDPDRNGSEYKNNLSAWTNCLKDSGHAVTIDSSEISVYNLSAPSPEPFQLTISVTNGWNMVATPGLHPVDQNVTTWWPGKVTGTSVFKYASGYVSVLTTQPGLGYWMKNNGAQTYNTGDEWPTGGINIVPNDPITVTSGWNMIGVYHYNVPKAGITTTGGSLTGSIFKYSSGYVSVDTLKPGYGYWAKMTAAGTIILPSSTFQVVAKQVETDTKDWGRIVITDNSGKIYTLYGVKGLVDLNNYELPPTPNAEMFDVRYGSNRYAEDLSSGNQSIEMQGMEYPIKVRVENMGIRLKDASGSGLNERLKAGEEVTISNSAISKLMVSGDVIPSTYSLEQNYPNPFNPSTKISWQSPIGSWHTLKVYDVLGNEVATLVNEYRSAGSYEIEFFAEGGPESSIKHPASGIYFYQLIAGKFVSVKKMLLLK